MIPATFCVPLIFAGQEDLQKGGELETLAELTGEIASGLEKGSVTGAVTPLQELRQLAPVYGPTWIKDGKLDEEAVREFLLAAKKMYDADMAAMDENMVEVLKDWGDSGFISTRAADRLIGYSRIGFGLAGEIQGDLGAVGQVMKEDGKIAFDLWKGPMGAGFVPKNKLSVAANARDMDSAKKFVSWMLSDKEQQISFNDGLPVNRTAFEKRCEPNDNVFYQTWRLPDGDKEISWAFPEAEVCSRFRGIVEKVDVCLETDAVVEEAVLTYGAEVLNGDRVCDSALREIKNAVVLYLAEQN